MIIAHGGIAGIGLEGLVVIIPLTLWLIIRRKYKPTNLAPKPRGAGRGQDPNA